MGLAGGIKEAPERNADAYSSAMFWVPFGPGAGPLHPHGNYGHFILMEPMVWKGQSLSSSHSGVSVLKGRHSGCLGV